MMPYYEAAPVATPPVHLMRPGSNGRIVRPGYGGETAGNWTWLTAFKLAKIWQAS
jgi:hypothetical protein